MTETLRVGKIVLEMEYKRIKTMRLTVRAPDGKVRVSVPFRTSVDEVRKFVVSKTLWIEKHQAKQKLAVKDGTDFINGEIHHVWGNPLRLRLVPRRGHTRFVIEDGELLMYVRPDADTEAKQVYLDKWYRGLVEEKVPALIAKWEGFLGIKIHGVYYRKMKSHWGSCNYGKRTIRINTELARKKPEYLEYVILHEMIHIIEPSHDRNFYKLFERYCPNWKNIRKMMHT